MVLQELLKYFNTETKPKSKTKKVIRNKKSGNKFSINSSKRKSQKGGLISNKNIQILSNIITNSDGNGGEVLLYRMYDVDDTTHTKDKNRCMCINYSMNGNTFSLKHNKNAHRCNRKVKPGTDFCNLHQNCKSFLRNYLSGYEPEYDTKLWGHPYIEGSHNCYAYFLNDVVESTREKCEEICLKNHKKGCPKKIGECRDLIPQPEDFHLLKRDGNLTKKIRKYYCPTMEKKIMSDNKMLKKVPFTKKCPKNHYKGAMVVDPNHTFHFYRQNPDGTWSHKPGTNPVTNLDQDDNKIYIPHFSNRDYSDGINNEDSINYTDFCGYYCIPSKKYSGTNSV
jgi:hypothetical protein